MNCRLLIIWLSLVCSMLFAQEDVIQQGSGPDQLVYFEAEHYHERSFDVLHEGEFYNWQKMDIEGASNDTVMVVLPDKELWRMAGSLIQFGMESPYLKYNVNFMASDTHWVWVRGRARSSFFHIDSSGADDSINMGIDDQVPESAWKIEWEWRNWWWWTNWRDGVSPDSQPEEKKRRYLVVDEPGRHDIFVFLRENGTLVDEIILTPNKEWTPPDTSEIYVPDDTSVKQNSVVSTDFRLNQNYPNPFNVSTSITYTISRPTHVKVTVFDLLGNKVAQLVNEVKFAGSYITYFDGTNISSGTYFYTLKAGSNVMTKKMILLK